MKTICLSTLLVVLFCGGALAADNDLKAVTEDGRKVILQANGKWNFDTSPNKVARKKSDFYQTKVPDFSLTYDNTKWNLDPSREGNTRQLFRHINAPVIGMVIADEIPANAATMKNIALYHAKKADPNAKIITEEMRKLSGQDILTLKFMAGIEGLEFFYHGNYYANENGNVQVICFTSQQLFHKYEADCKQFIDGLKIK